MITLLQDAGHALRGFAKAPGFTASALVVLAVAIGANSAVFNIADALLLRPLPLGAGSDRIVTLHAVHPSQAAEWDDLGMSWRDLQDVREVTRTLEDVATHVGRNFTLTGSDAEAERALGGSVTPNLFRVLGVDPPLGRHFADSDAAPPGFESVVIIGHGLWQRRFGGDPGLVGESILINERRLQVVGIMPRGFGFPERDQLWVPYRPADDSPRSARWFLAAGRRKADVSQDEVREELAVIAARAAESHPDTNRDWSFVAVGFRDFAVPGPARVLAVTLLSAVGLVLLAGCANLASLLLARGAGRARELAVRAALGAGRARLIRQMLTESVILAIAGGALGWLAAAWGVDLIMGSFKEPLPFWLVIGPDQRVLLFTAVLSLATGAAFGLIPALRASRIDLVPALADAGRSGVSGPGETRLHGALVVAQIALSLALLVGASILARSFLAIQGADPGFEQDSLVTLRMYLAGDSFDTVEARIAAFDGMAERLGSFAHISSVALTSGIPADDGGWSVRLVSEAGATAGAEVGAQAIAVSPSFFDVLGSPPLAGRSFEPAENQPDAQPVAIVNEALASRLWPGELAVGRRVGFVSDDGVEWRTVVGVAPRIQFEEFGEDTLQSMSNVYLPYGAVGWRTMALMARSEGDPNTALQDVRLAMRTFAPELPAYDYRTMEQVRISTSWAERIFSNMLAGFALAATLMACVGIYGVMAFGVSRRVREIGVRLALGAERGQILSLLLGRGLTLTLLGLSLGLPLAVACGRLLGGRLYGVEAFEPGTYALLALVLGTSAVGASYLPALRASRTQPSIALRRE